jgi:hypothetical protein
MQTKETNQLSLSQEAIETKQGGLADFKLKNKLVTSTFGIDKNILYVSQALEKQGRLDFKLYYTASEPIVASVYFFCVEKFDRLHNITTRYV